VLNKLASDPCAAIAGVRPLVLAALLGQAPADYNALFGELLARPGGRYGSAVQGLLTLIIPRLGERSPGQRFPLC
jgi:hypothetical protein